MSVPSPRKCWRTARPEDLQDFQDLSRRSLTLAFNDPSLEMLYADWRFHTRAPYVVLVLLAATAASAVVVFFVLVVGFDDKYNISDSIAHGVDAVVTAAALIAFLLLQRLPNIPHATVWSKVITAAFLVLFLTPFFTILVESTLPLPSNPDGRELRVLLKFIVLASTLPIFFALNQGHIIFLSTALLVITSASVASLFDLTRRGLDKFATPATLASAIFLLAAIAALAFVVARVVDARERTLFARIIALHRSVRIHTHLAMRYPPPPSHLPTPRRLLPAPVVELYRSALLSNGAMTSFNEVSIASIRTPPPTHTPHPPPPPKTSTAS